VIVCDERELIERRELIKKDENFLDENFLGSKRNGSIKSYGAY
jgi:hypothetical protein